MLWSCLEKHTTSKKEADCLGGLTKVLDGAEEATDGEEAELLGEASATVSFLACRALCSWKRLPLLTS